MGMLFNTHGTIQITNSGNAAFNVANFAILKANAQQWALTFAALPGPGPLNPNGGSQNLVNLLPDSNSRACRESK